MVNYRVLDETQTPIAGAQDHYEVARMPELGDVLAIADHLYTVRASRWLKGNDYVLIVRPAQ